MRPGDIFTKKTEIEKTLGYVIVLGVILSAAGYLFVDPLKFSQRSGASGDSRRPALVNAVLNAGKPATRRKLNDMARNLREFQYRLRSRLESRYSPKALETQYCENLGRLFEEIKKMLQDMGSREYPPGYLSQIEAARKSCERAMETLGEVTSSKNAGLVKLEEAVRMLTVHLRGLAANI